MANHLQIEAFKPSAKPECGHCEELLADAVDELLSPADQAFFDRHIAGCTDCMAALGDARRGAAWLEMIRTPRPEPSVQLLERILAATSGAVGDTVQTGAELPVFDSGPGTVLQPAIPAYPPRVLPFRPRLPAVAPRWGGLHGLNRLLFEPRLAMTAAMAFFSIALTLNLTGVHLNQLHASDLGPEGLRRSYYEATASATRRYEGLRVVHTMESRLDDLREQSPDREAGAESTAPESRRDLPPDPPAAPAPKSAPAEPKPAEPSRGGVSLRSFPSLGPRVLPVLHRKLDPASTLPAPLTHKEGGLA